MQASYQDVSDMLVAAAPDLGLASVTAYEDMGSWVLAIDDAGEEGVTLDHDAPNGRLMATAVIGPAPAENRLEVCEFLLSFNGLWAETGGARTTLDAANGAVTLVADAPLEGLTQEGVAGLVDGAAALARILATGIAEGFQEGGDAETSGPSDAVIHG
ncbi:MAG: type III secretion system chaperone [Pseudomonadota bacterium]